MKENSCSKLNDFEKTEVTAELLKCEAAICAGNLDMLEMAVEICNRCAVPLPARIRRETKGGLAEGLTSALRTHDWPSASQKRRLRLHVTEWSSGAGRQQWHREHRLAHLVSTVISNPGSLHPFDAELAEQPA